MKKTDDYKRYETQATPAPKFVPNVPTPSEPTSEADAELEGLTAANELLAAQVVSLSALLAETGMAEIWRHKWADLKRVATTDYVPGRYRIETPQIDDPELRVTLLWESGQVLLCEAFQRTPENTLALPLPSVRNPHHFSVPPPAPGSIPARPVETKQSAQWTMSHPEEQREVEQYNRKWQAHLQPVMKMVTQMQAQQEAQAVRDEEELAYTAIQEIQERRQKPRTLPGQTIGAELEAIAHRVRSLAAQTPC